ncbi:hypothetical protein O3G_MSEX005493 [Manduca sexta]|uniref:Ketoreductase domain-containing protein n=1 Tax=Manduca sexta TaxID=7130 RepID=A0A921Z0E5_MANSE|nr:hypothetical protein O3G_MSEX005493 [Manduca sexta]
MSFSDKVVLVTGGSSGIGAATAIAFAKEGAKVAIVGRNEEKLAATAAACGDNALVLRADISDEKQAVDLVKRTIDTFGKLDILVNNAGISRQASLLQGNILQVYDEVMNTNLRAVFHLTSLAAPHLIKTKGSVVNISSVGGTAAPTVPMFMTYSVSKAGLNHFTKAAAAELAPHGVRVNAISPGPVKTDIIENSGFPVTWDRFREMTALNRVAEPEEIADLVMFLASDKARSITGSNYFSDNGILIKK